MAFYFVDQPFLAMESAFPSPRFCRQQRSPCHQRRQQCRRMPSYANSMDQLMEEARRQVLLEQNRTSEALAMQNFLGIMNGIVDSFLKGDQKNETEVEGEKKSNSENETSASASKGESNPDNVPKNDDTKESNSKQKCSHPGALKDYFAAIDAIVNAMSGKNQQKTDEEENSVENGTTEKTADEEQKNNNFGEEKQQPMKDFLNVMDTIVGKLMTHHHNENSISEEKNLRQTEVVVDKLSAGGNADDNNVDQTIKIKTPTEAKNDEPKKEQVFNSTENEVAQEVLKNQPRSSIQQVSQQQKRLLTQVHVDENLDRVQIQIEFSGYDLKPENLDVQVVNNDILLVKAEKNDQKIFERKFKLSAKCQLDNIQPKFNDGGADADENSEQEEASNITQTLNILVPKVDVKKTVNIPINTTTSTTEE